MSCKAIVFLDIDGVLNGHQFDEVAQSCSIDRKCVENLNRILFSVECEIVVSSSWRYIVHGGAMTPIGFQYMLRTHGMRDSTPVRDITATDEEIAIRGEQIRSWRRHHARGCHYVVLDDMDLGISERGLNFVQTNGAIGLTEGDADRAISFLVN